MKAVVKTNAFIQLLLLCSLWAEVGISSDLGLKSYYSRINNTSCFIKVKMCLQLLLSRMEQLSWTCRESLRLPLKPNTWILGVIHEDETRASCKLNCRFKQALSFRIPCNEAVDIVVHSSLRMPAPVYRSTLCFESGLYGLMDMEIYLSEAR